MNKSTKPKFDAQAVRQDVIDSVLCVRDQLDLTNPPVADAWATLETFCAIALRVMAQTNPSKVRLIAMTVEIQNLMKPEFARAEVQSQSPCSTHEAPSGVSTP